jgi:large subunit ribosomal protein L15
MSQELLGLHNLEKNPKAKKRRIRRGRGNSSGHGNYSGRGMKGQKSRSGGKSGLKLRGIKAYMQRIPKKKGFKSARPKKLPINLSALNKFFEDGEVVSLKSLLKKNLIPKGKRNIKILASGTITKKLDVRIGDLSVKAKEAIIKAGGSILEVEAKTEDKKEVKKDNNKDTKKETKAVAKKKPTKK